MRSAAFTPTQRGVLVLMGLAIVVVFATLAGFVITSLQGGPIPTPTVDADSTSRPTPEATVPLSTATPEPEMGLWSQVQLARLLDQIERRVETLRGLAPRAEVALNFLDDVGMRSLLRGLHVQSETVERLFPYTALGLLPDASIRIQVPQAVGMYVPEQAQFYVTTGQQAIGDEDRALLLAHAYSHVLQDQYFDLQATMARATSTDAMLAAEALIEGDAALVAARYRYEDLDAVDWPFLEDLIVQAREPDYGDELGEVEAWARLQQFPYREGRGFVTALLQADGWEAVNRAYVDPPLSTEQVLHPERYLAEERDTPAMVFVPDLGGTLGSGWTLRLRDTLGELVTGLFVAQTLSEETAWQAADGWGGDTFIVWEHEEGGCVRVWRTVWDSAAEADEFERALVTLIPQRYLPTRPVEPPGGLPGRWWETGTGATYVYRVARYVTWVDASDVDTLVDVVEVLP